MNKKSDVFIYITAVLSFALMILLLTTSNSISYNLIDEYVQNGGQKKVQKINKVKQVIEVLKPQNAEAENLVSSASNSSNLSSDVDNEIDNLIVNILLNNKSETINQSDNKIDSDSDEILKIYDTEKPVVQNKTESIKKPVSIQKKGHIHNSYHIVKRGEYLSEIAKKYNIPLKQVLMMNNLHNPNRIKIGQKIYLNASSPRLKSYRYRIRKNDTILKIAKRYNVSYNTILSLNHIKNPNRIFIGQNIILPHTGYTRNTKKNENIKFVWPIQYHKISSPFGMRKNPFNRSQTEFHKGLDIPAPQGTSIFAALSGKVIFSGVKRGYGNVIILRHKNGYLSVYAHCLTRLVRVGQFVQQHQVIGKVGNTGKSTGPHLHFEIRKFSRPINPIAFLPKK